MADDQNLAHKVYFLTDKLPNTLQEEQLIGVEGKKMLGKNYEKEESADLLFESICKKTSNVILLMMSMFCQERNGNS